MCTEIAMVVPRVEFDRIERLLFDRKLGSGFRTIEDAVVQRVKPPLPGEVLVYAIAWHWCNCGTALGSRGQPAHGASVTW